MRVCALMDPAAPATDCSGRSWWSAIVVAIVAWLWSNTVHNLSVRRISTGFAFLGREAGMPIADSLARLQSEGHLPARLHRRHRQHAARRRDRHRARDRSSARWSASRGCPPNWLLSRLAAVYVEVLRDIPLLLQLLFWYVLMQGLPAARAALEAGRGRLSFQSRPDPAVDPARGRRPLGARRCRARRCRVLCLSAHG